jgi:UDP-glucose-4-epimerase GalE
MTFIQGDVGDPALMRDVFASHVIDAVMHFAGSIEVGESVTHPLAYYRNNTGGSLAVIEAVVAAGVKRMVFSSTAAVYGEPEAQPIPEEAPTKPINPYGWTKLMTEQMLRDASAAHGLSFAILRYFNVSGADPQGRAGESIKKPSHLIKRAVQVAVGTLPELGIFGEDYPTTDGTCVRDYIHVTDLGAAHAAAADYLLKGGEAMAFNLGTGDGTTVKEIADAVEKASGRPLPRKIGPRRAGDPPVLVASNARAKSVLGWTPKHSSIDEIVSSAWAWALKDDAR